MKYEEVLSKIQILPSYVLDDDIFIYYKYVSVLPKGAVVLDIATGWGKSAVAMALSNPNVKICTIDNGSQQMAVNWAKDQDDYMKKIVKVFADFNLKNVYFYLGDVSKYPSTISTKVDLLHIDMDVINEGKVLGLNLSKVKSGGIILVRNYNRFKSMANSLCKKTCEYLEHLGAIQVMRKI